MEEDEEEVRSRSFETEKPLDEDKYGDWGFNDESYSSDGVASESDPNDGMEHSNSFFPGADLLPLEGAGGSSIPGLPEGFSLIEFVKQVSAKVKYMDCL